jgi:hypothetical protein
MWLAVVVDRLRLMVVATWLGMIAIVCMGEIAADTGVGWRIMP